MQIQSRCSSWAGLVPDLCLDEKCAPWISLASGGGVGERFGGAGGSTEGQWLCWWQAKVALPVSSSFCQCPAEAPGFTQGLSDVMTKPLQSMWQRNAEEFSALEGNIVAWLIWKLIHGTRSKAVASAASQLKDLFIDGWLRWGSENSWCIFLPGRALACYHNGHFSSLIRSLFILGIQWHC